MLPSIFLPLVGVLFFGGFSPVSFGFAALGVFGTVVYAVIRWATFTYQVAGDRLELTRQFISRSVRTIPLERVRGVDVSATPLHRLLGLVVVRIDTGASGEEAQEGELNGVTPDEAERLRGLLLRLAPVPSGAHVARPEEGGEEPVLARAPRAWLRYGPLSGAYLLTPFAVLGSAIGVLYQLTDELGVDREQAFRAYEWVRDNPVLLVCAAVLLVLLMPVAGTIMYAVFNWDFTLRSRGASLVAERGLVTRRSVSLEHRRVRGYEIVDGVLERKAKVVRLWAIVAGLGDSETRGQLLPVAPRRAALAVAELVAGPFTGELLPHPPAALRRRLFRAVAPWLAAALAGLLLRFTPLLAAGVVLALLGVPLGLDRYRQLGHGFDGTRLSVRSGSLRRAQAVVERRAVVGWTLRQTWFQRQSGVVSVIAGVGAGSGGYTALDVDTDQAVAFAAAVTPAWITPFLAPDPPSRP
ncbi:hypothetical protein D5H75_07345 [Bailinhaonella thermotolerans]|uniref:YdbS-like PH domain-containing protein n=2 Tax=Bailinhaonella thermotolerans TaxID=1070861 RepID=A0A3A4BTM7_9ACTN|nr:hypothetical protein D5H75_07345 [Bailinhaonella thermotolerans]